MRPLLLSGVRHLMRHPLRVLQVLLAVALGVALFVSSYASIGGIRQSIARSAKAMAGKAELRVSRAGAGGIPESLVDTLRQEPGAVVAPFVQAAVTVLGDRPEKLIVWGIDMRSDSMLRLYGDRQAPDEATLARLLLAPNGVLVTKQYLSDRRLAIGDRIKVSTPAGAQDLFIAGAFAANGVTRAVGGALVLMDVRQAASLFGHSGRFDYLDLAYVDAQRLRSLVPGFEVGPVDALSPGAQDALLRVESLYGLSLVAMLIGCFVVFSSVQVTVLERLKEVATFRAVGASRGQVMGAILIEWLLVGLIGSSAGVAAGAALSNLILKAITGTINSMLPLVSGSRAELDAGGILFGIFVGAATVLMAALIPAVGAVRESPLLALRPHTYRLRGRQMAAFWIGVLLLLSGIALSATGSSVQSLVAIALSFFGLALLLPQTVLLAVKLARRSIERLFGFSGFLAADNLRKAPQRTALNVIALGGALAIMVSTASLVQGLGVSTRTWIRSSLPFDLAVMASDLSSSAYSEDTLPSSLADRIAGIPGVSYVYRVRKSFATHRQHDIMVIGIETNRYLEAHRRHGTLAWAHAIAEPDNRRQLLDGSGAFVSENFLALYGSRIGDSIEVRTPAGPREFRILGAVEDYSWPRGCVITDLRIMSRLWQDTGVTYVDVQVGNLSELPLVRSRIAEATRNQYAAYLFDRGQIVAVADDILRQTTAAADVQVWLAAIIGFLGIGNSLVMSVLQRQREIGLLRAVGMSRRQLQLTVAVEAFLIGISSGVLGMAGGLIGGWMPLRHFTFSVTGYLFPLVVPWPQMAIVFLSAVVIGVLAALVPMRQAAKVPVLQSIAYE